MAAAVIRKENESKVAPWLRTMRDTARNLQAPDMHFRKLSDKQKRIIAGEISGLPVRLFAVVSNKRNMRQHNNKYARKVSGHKHWFYWWVTRLLLERVTDFCADRNKLDGTPDRKLQIEFSRRKDLRLDDFTDYFTRLWAQRGNEVLSKRRINWSVFDFQKVYFFDHRNRAGLQFADVVASSFYQAVNIHPHGRCCGDYAIMLEPRIHRNSNGKAVNEGFTIWPHSLSGLGLSEDQKAVFRHYGYPENRLTD